MVFYAYSLAVRPIVDGYDDGGRDYRSKPLVFKGKNDADLAKVNVGLHQNKFYFFIKVYDENIHYYKPSSDESLGSDRLQFEIERRQYTLATSAPGNVVAYHESEDEIGTLQLHPQPRIKGVWREHSKGYQLELVVDAALMRKGFQLRLYDRQAFGIDTYLFGNSTIHMVALLPELQQSLAELQVSSFDLKVLNQDQWLIASVDGKNQYQQTHQSPWITEWLYRKVLESEKLPLANDRDSPYFAYPEVQQSLENNGALKWYRVNRNGSRNRTLASVAMPIRQVDKLLGYVVLEKTTDQLIALTADAFNRLFTYLIAAFTGTILILLVYASWLSWRISRLNHAANHVIDQQGAINVDAGNWPELSRGDELGDGLVG